MQNMYKTGCDDTIKNPVLNYYPQLCVPVYTYEEIAALNRDFSARISHFVKKPMILGNVDIKTMTECAYYLSEMLGFLLIKNSLTSNINMRIINFKVINSRVN